MADEKIILTKEEIAIIEKHLKGEINAYNGTDEEKQELSKIIDKAQDLCEKLDAYDEVDDNFVEWYYNYYKAQQ